MSLRRGREMPAGPVDRFLLQIAINYRGSSAELGGCINDADNLQRVFRSKFGFTDETIARLDDDSERKPTHRNIMSALAWLVELAHENEDLNTIVITYSGHGSQVHDSSGDERDRKDEVLVPLDYEESGMIVDDDLHRIIGLFPERIKVLIFVDACHSESAVDLPFKYCGGEKNVWLNDSSDIKCQCICISGCRDNQTAADAYDLENSGTYTGAKTTALLRALEDHAYCINFFQLLKFMHRYLRKLKFSQRPQITCTMRLDYSSLFLCVDPKPFFS